MAIVWNVKDGPKGDTTDAGKKVDLSSLTNQLENYKYVFSEGIPRFRVDSPSQYYEHIVIEVTDEDELNDKFTGVGFYTVQDLHPRDAGFIFGGIEVAT